MSDLNEKFFSEHGKSTIHRLFEIIDSCEQEEQLSTCSDWIRGLNLLDNDKLVLYGAILMKYRFLEKAIG